MNSYFSIKKRASYEFKERASKFIAYAFPIADEAEAKAKLEEIRQEHPKANHHCYAYQLLKGTEIYHIANDDGEPSNSAGMPILGQIRSLELQHVLVVVVRYFGGTKLGVGGLISAYKAAAYGALEKAQSIEIKQKSSLHFKADYQLLGTVMAIIDKNQLAAEIKHKNEMAYISLETNLEELEKTKSLFAPLGIELSSISQF